MTNSDGPNSVISAADLIAGLHRVRQKVRRLEQRFDLIYGEPPRALSGEYENSVSSGAGCRS